MSKFKKFWNNHKGIICFVGGGIAVATVVYLLYKQKGKIVDLSEKKVICWEPKEGSMNLEKVKEILEANKDNSSQFAIFREGPNPTEYVTIVLSDDVILP